MKAELIRHEPVPLPPPEVVITMSYEEARTLLAVTEQIAGIGERRHHVDHISSALRDIDIECDDEWLDVRDNNLTIIARDLE